MLLSLCCFPQSYGVSEPAALPGHQRQSDREPGEYNSSVGVLICFTLEPNNDSTCCQWLFYKIFRSWTDGLLNRCTRDRLRGQIRVRGPGPEPLYEVTVNISCLKDNQMNAKRRM